MRLVPVILLAAVAACSGSSPGGSNVAGNTAADSTANASGEASRPATIETAAGRYRVEIAPNPNQFSMPQNADLKMLDGDVTQYAVKLCGLDFANTLRPERCEMFVQPDKTSMLVGYAVVKQGTKPSIETAIETDREKTGLGCWISGDLENTDFEHPKARLNVGRDFEARLAYNAWEKTPGNWMVGAVTDDGDQEGAIGVWYIKHSGDKLRVTQERWSYCYSDPKVFVDEVFKHVLTLARDG